MRKSSRGRAWPGLFASGLEAAALIALAVIFGA